DLISQLPSASHARHATYVSRGVSFSTIGCRFLKTGGTGGESGFGWRHFGANDDNVPKYSNAIGDYFGPGGSRAIISNENFKTQIIGATIHVPNGNVGITAFGPAQVSDCHIIGETGAVYGVTEGSSSSGQLTIKDTVFEGDFVYGIRRIFHVQDAWKIGPNVEF